MRKSWLLLSSARFPGSREIDQIDSPLRRGSRVAKREARSGEEEEDTVRFPMEAGWPTHGFFEDAARIENAGDRVLGPT